MVGYVFLDETAREVGEIDLLFLGGDTRYGLGRLRREGEWESASDVFGYRVELSASDPEVRTDRLLAHGYGGDGDQQLLRGQCEVVGGWVYGSGRVQRNPLVLWTPGTVSDAARAWVFVAEGYWGAANQSAGTDLAGKKGAHQADGFLGKRGHTRLTDFCGKVGGL
jgi:hypothetical protein